VCGEGQGTASFPTAQKFHRIRRPNLTLENPFYQQGYYGKDLFAVDRPAPFGHHEAILPFAESAYRFND
jgi:hypothetical protein